MERDDHAVVAPAEPPRPLRRLLAAECAAEAPAAGMDAEDLEQAVLLRWLEGVRLRQAPPAEPAAWLRAAVRAEARPARRRLRHELPWEGGRQGAESSLALPSLEASPEAALLAGEHRRALAAAVGRLPGRCPAVVAALLARRDLTYREIAGELGMSQGSLGPLRSRCLGCLRRMLPAEIAPPAHGGVVR